MRVSKLDKLQDKLLHYAGKAIADYNMIQRGDRVMVCLSGGKASFTLLHLLHELRRKSRNKFEVFSYTLDQKQPGWDDTRQHAWLEERGYPYEIAHKDTYAGGGGGGPGGGAGGARGARRRRGASDG